MKHPPIYNVYSGEEVDVLDIEQKKWGYATLRWKSGGEHFTITLELFKLCYKRRT